MSCVYPVFCKEDFRKAAALWNVSWTFIYQMCGHPFDSHYLEKRVGILLTGFSILLSLWQACFSMGKLSMATQCCVWCDTGKGWLFPHCSAPSCQHTSAQFYGALQGDTWEAEFVLTAMADHSRLECGRQKLFISLYRDGITHTNLVVKHSADVICQSPVNYWGWKKDTGTWRKMHPSVTCLQYLKMTSAVLIFLLFFSSDS